MFTLLGPLNIIQFTPNFSAMLFYYIVRENQNNTWVCNISNLFHFETPYCGIIFLVYPAPPTKKGVEPVSHFSIFPKAFSLLLSYLHLIHARNSPSLCETHHHIRPSWMCTSFNEHLLPLWSYFYHLHWLNYYRVVIVVMIITNNIWN